MNWVEPEVIAEMQMETRRTEAATADVLSIELIPGAERLHMQFDFRCFGPIGGGYTVAIPAQGPGYDHLAAAREELAAAIERRYQREELRARRRAIYRQPGAAQSDRGAPG